MLKNTQIWRSTCRDSFRVHLSGLGSSLAGRLNVRRRKPMMILVIVFFMTSISVFAQNDTLPYRVTVEVDSAFVRAAPSPEADRVASVFEDSPLEVVGRNLDGTWFEVRRPERLTNLGWLFNEVVEWDFEPETLPLTDLATGIIGPTPLAADPGFAVHVREGAAMRSQPYSLGERIVNLPPGVTVPLLERDPTGEWLRVNYLGYEGWIAGFNTRPPSYLMDVPIAAGLPQLQIVAVEIIPPEVQLAQVQRMRAFVTPLRDLADYMANFWLAVGTGEIMPCSAPGFVLEYLYTPADVRQLPELQRFAPRMNQGVGYLNDAITPLTNCGIIDPESVQDARNDAINARTIFNATLVSLDNLEENVIR